MAKRTITIGNGSDSFRAAFNKTNLNFDDLFAGVASKVDVNQLGIPMGVATLNLDGKITIDQLPAIIADTGLSNVDNTSDINKPISTATAAALALKADASSTNTTLSQHTASILANTTVIATKADSNFVYGAGAVARTVHAKLRDQLSATDFGVVGDGIVDDTTALQTAINAAASAKKTLQLPPSLKLSGPLVVPAFTNIQGSGAGTNILLTAGTYNTFTITGSDVVISGLNITAYDKVNGWEFVIDCAAVVRERIELRNIVTFGSRGGITDGGSTGFYIMTKMDNVKFRMLAGPGFQLGRAFGFIYLTNCTADYVNVANSDWTGFAVDSSALAGIQGGAAGGVYFTDCQVLGTAGSYNNANQRGFYIKGAAGGPASDIEFNRCQADTVASDGFVFDTVTKLVLNNTKSSHIGGHAYTFTAVTNCVATNVEAFGRRSITVFSAPATGPYQPAGKDGLRFVSGCYSINIVGGNVRDFTGNGIHKTAAQAGPVMINAVQCAGNVGRGVKTVGDSIFHVKGGLTFGNDAGNYDLGGLYDRVHALSLDSGLIADASGPTVLG